MNLADAPLAMRHQSIPSLSLRRDGSALWVHCLTDGRWVESGEAPDAEGRVSHVTPLEHGPELARLLCYSTGFEVLGFFENLATPIPGGGWREIGTRGIPYPIDRGFGSFSVREFSATSPIEVTKGHRQVIAKASPEKPLALRSVAYPLCGRKMPECFTPAGFSRPQR